MSKVKRKTIHNDGNLKARIEEVTMKGERIIFIHIEVDEIKKSVIQFLKNRFPNFKKSVKKNGYNYLHTYSKTPKFYKFFPGYVELGDMEWEGETYKVLRWELNS
jgi:hypothetical protein